MPQMVLCEGIISLLWSILCYFSCYNILHLCFYLCRELSNGEVLCIFHFGGTLDLGFINLSYNGNYLKFIYVDSKANYSSILKKAVDVSNKVLHDKDHFVECCYHNERVHTLVSITENDDVRIWWTLVDVILMIYFYMSIHTASTNPSKGTKLDTKLKEDLQTFICYLEAKVFGHTLEEISHPQSTLAVTHGNNFSYTYLIHTLIMT